MESRKWMAALGWPFLMYSSLAFVSAQSANLSKTPAANQPSSGYVLGPNDKLQIWVLGLEDVFNKPVPIDADGRMDLPLIGPVVASGHTVEELRAEIAKKLERELKHPTVSVTVAEFGSQPVSVLGSVNSPGVHQLHGRMTLTEVLSLAGGLRSDAGPRIKISRETGQGPIELASSRQDDSGRFSVADVNVQDILDARNPSENIAIQPHDTITVPQGEMVYVIGAVRKPGGFLLHEREQISVLQALSMAEGLGETPAPQSSRILRLASGSNQRREIAVDLRKVLAGKAENIALEANDILLVPTNNGKKVGLRAIEAAVQAATGIAIWGR